jgi:thioredoxin reductase (NADPH)
MGVELVVDTKIGEDITLKELKEQGFEAVYMAVGAHEDRELNIEGKDLDGVYSGVEVLRDINLGKDLDMKDKKVTIIGGGNVAIEEADYLTKFASKVYLIHRRDKLRGDKILADRINKNDKVEILWSTEVKEIKGDKKVSGIVIENNKSNEKRTLENVKGLFMAVGYNPRTELFKGQIDLDEKNYILTDNNQRTNKEGIFAAGDVQEPEFSQVVVAAGSGAKAAMQVDKYLIGY